MNLPTDIYTLVFGYVNRLEIRPLSKILNEAFLEKFCYHPKPHGIIEGYQSFDGFKYKKSYRNGIKDGPHATWYPNGQLIYETSYKNGELDGPYKHWYINGKLCIETSYKNGVLDGPYKSWYTNGQSTREISYKNGVFDGSYKSWFQDGKLHQKKLYKNGIEIC